MPVSEDEVTRKLMTHVAMLTGTPMEQVETDRPLHLLGLDSMGFVDLLVFIEKQFNLSLMSSTLAQDDFASLAALSRRIVQASPT